MSALELAMPLLIVLGGLVPLWSRQQQRRRLQRRLAQEGETVSQCLRDVRLETALVLLQSSTLQVSEIAARCGYESHSRFSAAFRERFGFPPSQLRP